MGQNSDPMNLVGAGTATGAYAALRQMIADKIAAEERARRAMVEDRNFGLQNRQLDLQDQMRRDQLAETTRQHSLADAEQQARTDATLNDNIPAGREIGAGSPVFGRLERIGALAPKPLQVDAPPSALAADPTAGGAQDLPGTVANAPSPISGRLYTKQASEKQVKDKADAADKETQRTEQAARDAEIKRHNQATEAKPPHEPTPHYQLQPETDPTTGIQTGRFLGFNTLTNSWEPVKGQGPGGTKAPPGAAANATQEHKKKEALTTLDQIDAAIENAKDLIGPGAGRVGKLEQLMGNPDPRLNALGTKLLMGKMQVDAGIGGARAAASPQLLARWDNLLSQNLTPDALKASVQALREILGSTGTAPTGKSGIKSITEIK